MQNSRYALFVLAGLISISKKRTSAEESDDEARKLGKKTRAVAFNLLYYGEDQDSKRRNPQRPEAAASLAATALETSGEDLGKVSFAKNVSDQGLHVVLRKPISM